MLQIDPCFKLVRRKNLLEEINFYKNRDFVATLVDSVVISNYGKRKMYKIISISSTKTPKSTFYSNTLNKEITFAEYYKDRYGLIVSSLNQPLVKVIIRIEKRITKDNKMEKVQYFGFLIPEFISVTGITEQQRKDYNFMKKMASYTMLSPNERMQENVRAINILNRSEKLEVKDPQPVQAYQLKAPKIQLGNNRHLRGHQSGYFSLTENLRMPVKLKNWILVYSKGRNPKDDDK